MRLFEVAKFLRVSSFLFRQGSWGAAGWLQSFRTGYPTVSSSYFRYPFFMNASSESDLFWAILNLESWNTSKYTLRSESMKGFLRSFFRCANLNGRFFRELPFLRLILMESLWIRPRFTKICIRLESLKWCYADLVGRSFESDPFKIYLNRKS